MPSEPDRKEHLPSSNYWFALQSPSGGWFKPPIGHLKIATKISLGYALALGIGIGGTICGFLLGNYYQQQAEVRKEQINQEIRFLYRLENRLLESRNRQQELISLLTQPQQLQQEYSNFTMQAAQVQQLWLAPEPLRGTEGGSQALREFLENYEAAAQTYFRQVKELVQQMESVNLNSPGEINAVRDRLLEFTNGAIAREFDEILAPLNELIQDLESQELLAVNQLKTANPIRVQVIVGSMVLSVAIATFLAIYTIRAIARPIRAVTDVAQRVTDESNFDLYVPVTSSDEIGVLADSFNQLIFRARSLLDNLQAEKEAQLLQSEKMASLGRMVANVAQEIKNPLNFIYGNLDPAEEYFNSLLILLNTYSSELPKLPPSVRCLAEEMEIDFIKEDLPKILRSMKIGAKRARAIVLIMKNFSRLDDTQLQSVDLHKGLDSTLLIFRNRIKKRIKVVRDYGNIPVIEGYTGLIYQVLMNLISNAIEALEENAVAEKPQRLTIATRRIENDWVEVQIRDNGPGISPENRTKIFDTFFTTKKKGVNHGLGLAICRQIVVSKHGGKITCESELGKGTEFAIALPIKQGGSSGTFIQKPFSE